MLDICTNPDQLRIIRIIRLLIDILKILVPIALLIKTTIDVGKITLDPKNGSNSMNMIIKRFIAALVIFFIPSFIETCIQIFSNEKYNFSLCLENATLEKIELLTEERVKELIRVAKNTLSYDSYLEAKSAVDGLDSTKKQKYKQDILDIEKYLEIKGLIYNQVSGSADIRSEINNIEDSEIKDNLNRELDANEEFNNPNSSFNEEESAAIEPNSSENIIKKEETDTLKVYIIKNNGYYVTKIWAKNPYEQLNKFDSPNYGKSLERPGNLLSKSISQNNLGNKLIIAFNASGFYLKDTYDSASVEAYPAYNKTSVGSLVITNGKVIRNAYSAAVKTWFIAGIKPNNELQIFTDAKNSNKEAKQEWANNVINTKIRNTFTFASPLITNGTASDITTSMPSVGSEKNRQAICQINANNFILITGTNLNRKKLIQIMQSYKCLTGTNFDGGGSIALLFKSKNSSKIKTIIGNRRSLSEVGYFTEQ